MKLLELLLRYLGGGIEHHIHGALVLGEGDHIPDALLTGKEHHHPIDPRGDAAMGRGTIFKGLKEVPEPPLDLLFAIP